MERGWVKSYRKIEDWEWYREPNTCLLFQHLIRRANHEDKKWKGIEVPKGCLITSFQALADQTGLSVRNVRTAIKHLKSTHDVTQISTRNYTLFKVENYEKYQCTDIPHDIQVTHDRHTSDIQVTTNKNERIKELKNKTPLTPLSQEAEGSVSAESAGEKLAALTGQELGAITSNPVLAEALNAFVQMRAAQRKPLTRYALGLLLAKLNRMASSESEKIEIVQNSVMNGWQSFVPLQKAAEELPGLPDWYANTHEDEEPDPDLIQQAIEIQKQLNEWSQEEEKMYGQN